MAYQNLIRESGLYPEAVIRVMGEQGRHWEDESWKDRELSLRHDMVCILLCNTERMKTITEGHITKLIMGESSSKSTTSSATIDVDFDPISVKRKADEMLLGGPSKIRKIEESAWKSIGDDETLSTDEEGTDDIDKGFVCQTDIIGFDENEEGGFMIFDPDEEYERDFSDDEKQVMTENIEETLSREKYRYSLLEGSTNEAQIHSIYTSVWKINTTNKKFDIVDKIGKKFIEVKVSLRPIIDHWAELRHEISIPEKNIALIVANPETLTIEYLNLDGEKMPGHDLAIDFLTSRREYIIEKGMKEDSDELFYNTVMKNEWLNNRTKAWINRMLNIVDINELKTPENRFEFVNDNTMKEIKPKDLYALLTDTRSRQAKQATWKGKILPTPMNEWVSTEYDTDKEMVSEFFLSMEETKIHLILNWEEDLGTELFNSIKEFQGIVLTGENEHAPFEYIKILKKRKGQYRANIEMKSSLLKMLGIGQKKRSYILSSDGMVQPEYEEHKEKSYPYWMKRVLNDLSKDSDMVVNPTLNVIEIPSVHPMGRMSQQVTNHIFQLFKRTEAAKTCYKEMGAMSRLGGAYLIGIGKKSAHSSVACLPLYCIGERDGIEVREVCGVIIRGPHHVRESTDRINIITIEKIKEIYIPMCLSMINKGVIITNTDPERGRHFWIVRQNAIRKTDPTYGAFIHNLLFVPCNYIGDLIMNHPNIAGHTATQGLLNKAFRDTVTRCNQFYKNRFSELTIMGLIGGSQEEGYFSFLRKVFMMLLEWSRKESVYNCDLEGLVNSGNECLIDSSYVLYLHEELRAFLLEAMNSDFSV
uniref:Polymerase PA n=1 Tax=Beihai orthomyxo-like virus 1 TaxID=1922494 RepID=A0A1L3KKE5_9VIRU|nr:polymerase PA [Beihai orthomyxo-like virus 1]